MGCGGSKSDGTQPGSRSPRKGNQGRGRKAGSGKNNNNNKVPVNEKGYKKRIRENLRQASAGNDIEELEKAMTIFDNNHMEDGGDYSEAERRLDFLYTRKEIRDACMRKHPVVLDKAIQKVEASPYKKQLKSYLDRAYYLKQHQNELETYRHDISNLDQSCISEIRSYHHPPPPVHTTMIATYMVLGYPEDHLTDWTVVTALMGRVGNHNLKREVEQVDTTKIDNTTGLRARNYLCQYSLDEVRGVSTGAAAFYVWTSKIVGKYDPKGKGGGADTQPKPLRNSGKKTQPTGSQPATPASQTKPATTDSGKDRKQAKQQDNKTKQQADKAKQQADNKAKQAQQDAKTKQDNKTKQAKQTADNKQAKATKNASKTADDASKTAAQDINSAFGKTTKKG